MSNYFKPKEYIKQAGDKLKIQITGKGETKDGRYGKQTDLDVIIGGEKMTWSCNEKYLKSIKDAGCGATFWMMGYKTQYGSVGYSFAPLGDVSASSGTEVDLKKKTAEKASNEDEYQKKINRGAAYNLAFQFCLKAAKEIDEGDVKAITLFLSDVSNIAEAIAPHQKAFVNGEKKESVREEIPLPKEYEPVDEHFDPVEEHSLPF